MADNPTLLPASARERVGLVGVAASGVDALCGLDRGDTMAKGKPPNSQREAIMTLLHEGVGPAEVARQLGVNKNVVIGLSHRAGLCEPMRKSATMAGRLDALHDRLDRVLAETLGVGLIANEPKGRG